MLELLKNALHHMERPEPWGAFHLTFFVIGIPLAICAAFLLRKLSGKAEKRLYLTVGILLIVSEIFKQLAFTAVEGSYRFDLIPFQLCSIPMYLCIIIGIMPEKRFVRASKTFIATFGLMGGVASYISPGSMMRDYFELTLHSFLWHLTLIFLGFFVLFSLKERFTLRDFGDALLLYLALCAIALVINLLCINAPGRDVNMFYIGPKPSNLPVCRDITARFGVAVNSILYVSALSTCAGLVCCLGRLLTNKNR